MKTWFDYTNARRIIIGYLSALLMTYGSNSNAQSAPADPILELMQRAAAHAKQHGDKYLPALSPVYQMVLVDTPSVHVKDLQNAGFLVVPWTVDDLPNIRKLIDLHVDGIISDRPDLLAIALKEARASAAGNAAQLAYLDRIDMQGHRGAADCAPKIRFQLLSRDWITASTPSRPIPALLPTINR